jgi:hypothetical protein
MNSRCGEGRASMVRDQAAARAYADGVMKKKNARGNESAWNAFVL